MAVKGEGGCVLVVGGSVEYTGAPYFCAMGALRTGAELAYVICSRDAALPIKCYSPELIVCPLLPEPGEQAIHGDRVQSIIDRCHVAIIGPGLSRDQHFIAAAGTIMNMVLSSKKRVILDGDGIHMISSFKVLLSTAPNRHLISITPNIREYERLVTAWNPAIQMSDIARSADIDPTFAEITILRKGATDAILCSGKMITVSTESSKKRCGGQGDILAGVFAQAIIKYTKLYPKRGSDEIAPLAGEHAALIVRDAARKAGMRRGDGLVAGDILIVL